MSESCCEDKMQSLLNTWQQCTEKTLMGENLREIDQDTYFAIRDLRHEARTMERQCTDEALNVTEINKIWRTIEAAAINALQRSKDLEITVWLCEALLRTKGFPGLAWGITLLKSLVTLYCPHFYPLVEDGQLDSQVFPLIGFNGVNGNGSLVVAMSVADLAPSNQESFSYWDYQTIVQEHPEEIQNALKPVAIRFGYQHVECMMSSVQTIENDYRILSDFLDQQYGAANAPPTSAIFKVIQDIKKLLDQLLSLAPKPAIEVQNANPDQDKGLGEIMVIPSMQSRQQALQTLSHIAQYFRTHEPSSPLVLLLERAVSWGNMSLSDLLPELIDDQATLQMVGRILGIVHSQNESQQ